ncbi:LPXTG cell wall anchor domain-containing protein [Actinocatenispora rupis]|uniref:LPXTG-motif cell wall anchor domain-containing protein n=1 Tax=Actinocatenispora rupis TaxID=519421 RepID=A0A8J3JDB6_9ACTN|nr:LPXTG cell wall anchor domain-containing protein [Actinocatenispora rupis]GID14367.1 hypothetical protein Aru02nite_52560 [Actinocatenispora rupis]
MPRTLPARRFLGLIAAAAIGLFGAFLISSPASAHDAAVKGTADCQSDGTYTVTWTIANDWTSAASITDVKAAPVDLKAAVADVAAKSSTTATQPAVPADAKQATLDFTARWSDGYSMHKSGTVTLPGTCTPKPDCVAASAASYQHTFDGAKGTATVSLADGQKLCKDSSQDFSLASYTAQSAGDFASSLPQTLFDQDSGTIDAKHTSVTLTVKLPDCYVQVDLIWGGKAEVLPGFTKGSPTYGSKILGSKGAPGNLSKGDFGAYHGGSTACVVASTSPSVSPSASPSATSAAPVASSPAPGAGGGLPVTGTSLTAFIAAAVVLIGGGAALFVLARKRRATPAE